MSERPIIFSGPMVRAILDGRKTQTRRLVKPQPCGRLFRGMDGRWYRSALADERSPVACPYGQPGDLLWVRETWAAAADMDDMSPRHIPRGASVWYREDQSIRGLRGILNSGKNRPGIFMPRWASRITLEIVSVRVERLQEISARDILAEGAVLRAHDDQFGHNPVSAFDGCVYLDLKSLWAAGWNSINAKRAPWAKNPWVWVIEFRRIK